MENQDALQEWLQANLEEFQPLTQLPQPLLLKVWPRLMKERASAQKIVQGLGIEACVYGSSRHYSGIVGCSCWSP